MYYDTDTLHPNWERGWHHRHQTETFPENDWVTLRGEHYLRSPSPRARPATARATNLERSDLNSSYATRSVRPVSASRMTRSRSPVTFYHHPPCV